jgi:predicted nucleotidyltransferase
LNASELFARVVKDRSGFREAFFSFLEDNRIGYCVIEANAYVEPLISLDLDVAVAIEDLDRIETLLSQRFRVEKFEHSINASAADSDLRVQIQTDPRYAAFVQRATAREVLDLTMQVAAVEDVLQGKLWAFLDETRRASRRQKDLADIGRLIEAYPHLRERVPPEVLDRLI